MKGHTRRRPLNKKVGGLFGDLGFSMSTKRGLSLTVARPNSKLFLLSMLVGMTLLGMLRTNVWMFAPGRSVAHQHDQRRLKIVPIPRIKVSDDVSYEEFFRLAERKPVIIEGAVRHHPAFDIGWADLKELCGKGLMLSRVYSKESTATGGTATPSTTPETLGNYIDDLFLHKEIGANNTRYASFMNLPQLCPIFERLIKVNKYVSFDLHQASTGYDFRRGQPEMFMGPPGTKSEIHIDNPYYPFWMNVYKGAKRFRTIEFKEAFSVFADELSLPRVQRSVGFWPFWKKQVSLEIFNPDFEVFPELLNVTVFDGIVNAGDFIYLPPAMLHGALNEMDSFGLSINSLPLPHIPLHLDVVDKLKRFSLMFPEDAGCEGKPDLLNIKKCMQDPPVLKKLKTQLNAHKENLEDRPLHDVYGFESSDEYCAYQEFYEQNFPGESIPYGSPGSWKRNRLKIGEWNKYRGCKVDRHAEVLSRLLNT